MQEETVATKIKGPGEKLKSARESLGLSIWDVASQLYLPERVIIALEEDDYHEGLPVRAFVRGYVQSYSKLLDLPSEELLAEFDAMGIYKNPQEESSKPLVQPRVVLTEHKDKFWFAIVGASLLAILTLIVALTWFNTHKEKQEDVVNQTLQEETILDQAQITPPVPTVPPPSIDTAFVAPPVVVAPTENITAAAPVDVSTSTVEPEIRQQPKNKTKSSTGNKKTLNKKSLSHKTSSSSDSDSQSVNNVSTEEASSEVDSPF